MKLRLAEKRRQSGLSQLALSRRSGVARGYISELENNKYNPTVGAL